MKNKIKAIQTRKNLIESEQSALLANYGSGTDAFFKMAESNSDDCIKFIALESEHLELNQTLLRIGMSLNQIRKVESLCTN